MSEYCNSACGSRWLDRSAEKMIGSTRRRSNAELRSKKHIYSDRIIFPRSESTLQMQHWRTDGSCNMLPIHDLLRSTTGGKYPCLHAVRPRYRSQ